MNTIRKKTYQFWGNLPVLQRGLIIMAIPIISLITSLTTFSLLQLKLAERENKVNQAQKINAQTKRLLMAIVNAEIGVQRYIITGQSDYLDSYQIARSIVHESFQELQPLIEQNAKQEKQFELAQQLIEESFILLQQLEQKRDRSEAIRSNALLVTQLFQELATNKNVIEEAKKSLSSISAIEESRLLLYQNRLKKQKQIYRSFALTENSKYVFSGDRELIS